MKEDKHIRDISEAQARVMLQRWYAAELDAVEEARLALWFEDVKEIPDDIKADAELFRALYGDVQRTSGLDGFNKALDNASCSKKFKGIYIQRWATAIVSALIVVFVIFLSRVPQFEISDPGKLAAAERSDTVTVQGAVTEVKGCEVMDTGSYMSRQKYVKETESETVEDETSVSIEQARRTVHRAFALLEKSSRMAGRSIQQSDSTVASVQRIMKKIM